MFSLPRRLLRSALPISARSSAMALRRRPRSRPSLDFLEPRCLLSTAYESFDGTGTNLANPDWGSADTDLLRIAAAAYTDGIDSPSLPQDQSARAISNLLNDQSDPNDPTEDINTVDLQSLSDFGYAFGQFMDHDMDLTPDGGASFPIAVAADDPIGPNALPFTRSQTDPATGTSTSNPAQQVNTVTSFLDLSQVYGSNDATALKLRTLTGGQMKTGPGDLLPLDNSTNFPTGTITMANDSGVVPADQLFATGDVRGNENIELTALQTLFVRNHNLIASQLQAQNPTWTDEQLYQEARKLNIAEYQKIVYTEWIPAVLGTSALPAYTGYDSSVNPSIANEFSTVAFRFGHSLLSGDIDRQNNDGLGISDPAGSEIDLSEDFFDPNLLSADGSVDPLTGHVSTNIGVILKAEADGVSQATDLLSINDVRNLLFGNAGDGGDDLIARDIQRGRDNGIPDYNTLREAYGLAPVTSFAQITSDVTVQNELKEAYGSVDNIDAFEGGLAEDHVAGSDVGPLFQAIMVDQFTRLRDGDSYFYLNEQFTPSETKMIQGASLGSVIEANTNVTNLQSDVFVFKASISGTVVSSSPSARPGTAPQGLAGVTVELEDATGNILATTVTDHNGHYAFDQLSGVAATGEYNVRLAVPSGSSQTSPNPTTILISRGDQSVDGVNFRLTSATNSPTPTPTPTPTPPPPPVPAPPHPAPPRFPGHRRAAAHHPVRHAQHHNRHAHHATPLVQNPSGISATMAVFALNDKPHQSGTS